jgi:hypothetical protein
MAKAIKIKTTVLPGHRIEVTDPELTVGQVAEVIVLVEEAAGKKRTSMLDFIASLPERHHTPEEWAQIEAELQADRDSWDR